MSNSQPLSSNAHLMPLDGLRGLAILLVLATHLASGYQPGMPFLYEIFEYSGRGWLGVDLFFVLSGFLITSILVAAKNKPYFFINFYARRTLRIFPLYYATLAIVLLLLPQLPIADAILNHPAHPDSGVWFWLYIANVLNGIKGVFRTDTPLALGHFWSLAVEEHFYLLWPLVIYTFPPQKVLRLSFVGIALASIARVCFYAITHNRAAAYELTPFRADSLLFGCVAALAIQHPSCRTSLARFCPRFAAIIFLPLLLLMRIPNWDDLSPYFAYPLFASFFAALLLTTVLIPQGRIAKAFSNGILRFFGRYSYGLYVYHVLLISISDNLHVADRLAPRLHSNTAAFIAAGTLTFTASILLSVASYHLFEKHFLRLKRFFEPQKLRSPAHTPEATTPPLPFS